jgi:hypothetical protein
MVVVQIRRRDSGPVVHMVVVEVVAGRVVVVDVWPVDAPCYVVPILQIVVTALVVVQ